MSLCLKLALALVVLLAVADAAVHRHHKKGSLQHPGETHDLQRTESLEDVMEHIISGKITCNGRGVDSLRPYLHSPFYPRTIISIQPTLNGGEYRLTTGTMFDTRGSIDLMVRHQCRIYNLNPMDKCAVPYYTTNIRINLNGAAPMIERNMELSDMKSESTADCLY
ncbi:unnamed protein product [Caenorhabditis brenneri]